MPADAVSGIYFAKLVARPTPAAPATSSSSCATTPARSDLLFQTSDTTWQAYNSYGGNSLYVGRARPAGPTRSATTGRSTPAATPTAEDFVFNAEYPMVRWLEANGYDVSYTTGVDTDRRGAELLEHKVFLSVGHDEYWSGGQRANVEAARDAGVNLAFFSGNEVFWKTRWENSIDGSGTPYRTLVSYKETHANAKIDPSPAWTGTWRDPRFSPPADGGRPENALTGTHLHGQRLHATTRSTVPAADGKLRFWRNTSVATLPAGAGRDARPPDTLGYEWDEDLDNGFRPAGPDPPVLDDASTVASVPARLRHRPTAPGTATHSLTLYRARQRRAGLRRRHGPVVLGPRRQPRPAAADHADVAHAAGDGQPVRRHGRPAGDAAGRPGRRHAPRPTPPRPTSTITSPAAGATVPVGSTGHHHRHRHRRRRRRGRRRRGLGRRRRDLAPGHRARASWTLHLDARRARHRSTHQEPRGRRQRQPRDRRGRAVTVHRRRRRPARASIWHDAGRPGRRLADATPPPSSSA